jgi:hypothetical protein
MVKHGIPKGSNLWALLLMIYINDLSRTINILSESISFADDIRVLISSKVMISPQCQTNFSHLRVDGLYLTSRS